MTHDDAPDSSPAPVTPELEECPANEDPAIIAWTAMMFRRGRERYLAQQTEEERVRRPGAS